MGTQHTAAARIMPQASGTRWTSGGPGSRRRPFSGESPRAWFKSVLRTAGAAALVLLLPTGQAQTQGVPQTGLPRTELTAGMHRIVAEVAADHAARAIGLMHRRSLAPNHGMLFVFQEKSPQCFWMRNTLIALSIAFIDDDGRVVNIEDMAPLTENSHCSKEPVRFALEMEQGWFARRGIRAGDRLGGREVFKSP